MKKYFLFITFTIFVCFSAPAFSVVNWNIQTFFDANTEGTEYSEFKRNAAWNESSYKNRLIKLCDAITEINADIFVFEEIENSRILYDISNLLCASKGFSKRSWNYACFSKNRGSAIGCAVLSKLPLSEMSVHNLDIRSADTKQPAMRPVIMVKIADGGKTATLLVNHWKSKSGGEEESKIWRDFQESLLSKLFEEYPDETIIACGDFNKDIKEFTLLQEDSFKNVCLKNQFKQDYQQKVYCPWLKGKNCFEEPGSYYYKNKWERIDIFFTNKPFCMSNFEVLSEGPWADENGKPDRFKISSENGYSDHFPVKCNIRL